MRILIPLLALALTSCGTPSSGKPVLAASIYPISFLVSSIAGEEYEVMTITPVGTEPHDYQPTPSTVKRLYDAKAIFLNGYHFEGYASSFVSSLQEKSVYIGEKANSKTFDGVTDPHVWLSTLNYGLMAQRVLDSLCALNPAKEDLFKANYQTFKAKLDSLTSYCTNLSSTFQNKTIAVSHAAYGYLCDQFHIEQLYISKLSPNVEPTQQAIEAVMDAIQEKGIDTVFFEELASPEIANAIASRTGAKTEMLHPLEGLTEEEEKAGKDYFSIYRENMDKIARAKP